MRVWMSQPKIHDLSVTLRRGTLESRDIQLTLISHDEAARLFARDQGVRVSSLPHGTFFSDERIVLGSHDGTHLDAPYHFYPTSEGRPAKLIDEWPLAWAMGPGLRLDFRTHSPSEPITEYDVVAALERIGRQPLPGEVVMLWTGGTDGYDTDPTFSRSAAGLNGGALNYLFRFGVRLMSTDSATIDVPIPFMRERLLAGDSAAYFPVHRAGRHTEWTHAEKLAAMGSLPGHTGFTALFFPIKIAGATGAWTRAVAIEDPWLEDGVEPIDLSLPIMNASFESCGESRVTTIHHDQSRALRAKELGWTVDRIPHNSAMDHVSTTTHSGTHIDAPFHFRPEGRTIDEVPLDWFYGDGVLLDFSSRSRGTRISLADVRGEIDRLGAHVGVQTIVLVRTGAGDTFADDPAFPEFGAGLDLDAFTWLLDQGVRVVGCDQESLEGPLAPMMQAFRSGDREALYPVHYLGRERDFCLIEKMDLSRLSRKTGFKVAAFPIKLERSSASWTRAVALVRKVSE
jgi:kynurenine formamidase